MTKLTVTVKKFANMSADLASINGFMPFNLPSKLASATLEG
jgi:hypothetical protein